MSAYGDVSILAAKRCQTGKVSSPVEAWESAVAEIFPVSLSLQKKACPRGAFLGLCEGGLVSGIARGHYTKSKRNKEYALKAGASAHR